MKRLYVVGIGPGAYEKMTQEAKQVLDSCDVIAGYQVYVDLVSEYYPEKEYIVSGMMQEEERCRQALISAADGKTTAMICSGDAGVYGMASLILQLAVDFKEVEIHVVAGVTAALAGGAVLGAPLGHDFVVISLSDLLTPWEVIENRLRCAAKGDFVICLYNPSSKKRKDYLKKACEIILEERDTNVWCGFVQNIGREGETYRLLPIMELKDTEVDMFTTVYIGSTNTVKIGDRMITPRGYHLS